MWLSATIIITKLLTRTARLLGSHGTALPGLIAEQLHPHILGKLTAQLSNGVIVVTGTNGKTTTSKILRQLLEAQGHKVLANRSGSNFTRGIISSMVEHVDWRGRCAYDIAVLEVDEAYTPIISEEIKPALIVVLNIVRDQLDRYGEIDTTAKIIGRALKFCSAAALNSDDPPVAGLRTQVKNTTFFGSSVELQKLLPADDELFGSKREKGPKIEPNVKLTTVIADDSATTLDMLVDGAKISTKTQLEGVHNFVNIAAAVAALKHLKPQLSESDLNAIAQIEPAFGRGETTMINGVPVRLALVKNPAGFNQNLRAFMNDKVGVVLFMINDRVADGRDVSWLWDIDLSKLHKFNGPVISSGVRGFDMSLRLKYEDINVSTTIQNIGRSLQEATIAVKPGQEVLVLPTYTAMLEARKELSKQADLMEIWR